jgi:hypothetical protein
MGQLVRDSESLGSWNIVRLRKKQIGMRWTFKIKANSLTVQTGELPVRYNTDGTIALMAPPKETREFNGKSYVMEESIFGDYAFVKVAKADRLGNCQFGTEQFQRGYGQEREDHYRRGG